MISLSELAARTNAAMGQRAVWMHDPERDAHVETACFDSRNASALSLFVALMGVHVDGHDFLKDAIEQGANAVLVQESHLHKLDIQVPMLVCQDTRAVLGALSAEIFDHPMQKMDVVGITGTNGKTTISYIMEAMMDAAGKKPGVIGTVNYRWEHVTLPAPNTTPESLIAQRLAHSMLQHGVKVLIMEVSSHGLATHRLDGARFDVAIWTNFTQDHLDFHGTMEEYRLSKERLFFEFLKDDGHAIININDGSGADLARRLAAARPRVSITRYALSECEGADLFATDIHATLEGVRFSSPSFGELSTPMLGTFNINNTLAACEAARLLAGASPRRLQAGLDLLGGVPGRLERVNPGQLPAVFVDYAHTPDALERTLGALKPLTPGQLRVVFGCGGDRDRGKRSQMGLIATKLADRVFVTSDNPRYEPPAEIIEAILQDMSAEQREATTRHIERAAAIYEAIEGAQDEDVILIAGKGHETYQELAGGRIDFDDREHARIGLKRRRIGVPKA